MSQTTREKAGVEISVPVVQSLLCVAHEHNTKFESFQGLDMENSQNVMPRVQTNLDIQSTDFSPIWQ